MPSRPVKRDSNPALKLTSEQKQTLSLLSPITTVDPRVIVPRTNIPEQLQTEISPAEPVKLFVAGQRGMGKTTELKRFVELLSGTEFLPVFLQFGSQESINHSGLLRGMAAALYATEELEPDDRLFDKFQEWYDVEESGSTTEETRGGKASLGGNYVVFGASGEITHLHRTTKKKTRAVAKTTSELIIRFNEFVHKAEKSTGRRIVFVVDDIDKVQDADSINSTFIHSSHIIGSLNSPCVFTVPITYATSNYVRIAGLPYNGIHRVPAVDLFDENGKRNPEAQAFMRRVFELRMPFNPVPMELLDQVLDYSGGVLIDAMRMLRDLCRKAIMDPTMKIEALHVQDQFQQLVDDYQFVIDRRPLWEALGSICSGTAMNAYATEGLLPELLYKMIVIEYKQRRSWFAPHPAARRLYEQNANLFKQAQV